MKLPGTAAVMELPSASNTMFWWLLGSKVLCFVGSCYKALYRNYKQPTKNGGNMVVEASTPTLGILMFMQTGG